MALPVPYYRYPNTHNNSPTAINGAQVAYINVVGGLTASGTQNRNGGTIAWGRPGATQSRFHLENDGTMIQKISDRVGGYPVDTVAAGAQQGSGAMAVTRINASNPLGKVYPFQYIAYMLKGTQQVAGATSTLLQTPGARFGAVDKAVQNRNPGYNYTPHVILNNGGYGNLLGWNYITGRILTDSPSGTKDVWNSDVTAAPTRALPGLLVYLDAGKTIFSGYFKPKTS